LNVNPIGIVFVVTVSSHPEVIAVVPVIVVYVPAYSEKV
jgi:hypothetical protein